MSWVHFDIVLEPRARASVVNVVLPSSYSRSFLLLCDLYHHIGRAYISIPLISMTCDVLWPMKSEQTQNTPYPSRSSESFQCLSSSNFIFLFAKRMAYPKKGLLLRPRFWNEEDICHRAMGQPTTSTEDKK